jgi:hypothetical protein
MKSAMSKRLEKLEEKIIPPILVLIHRTDETKKQAIARQYPDGLPDAQIHVFIKKYVADDDVETERCD